MNFHPISVPPQAAEWNENVKKIGFITKNKVLAQSLASLIKSNPDLLLEPYVLSNFAQSAIDVEVFGINAAVVDMTADGHEETGVVMTLCKELRETCPGCRILLLVPQDNKLSRDEAMKAVDEKVADDYLFLDTSLDYLIAKLLAI